MSFKFLSTYVEFAAMFAVREIVSKSLVTVASVVEIGIVEQN